MHTLFDRQVKTNRLHHAFVLSGNQASCLEEIDRLIGALGVTPADVRRFAADEPLGIAQVREIVRELALAPHSSSQKVMVMPGHRLRPEAAQALLKTLEEPPARSLLLLYTPNERLVPQTIVSRCQRMYIGQFRAPEPVTKTLPELAKLSVAQRFAVAQEIVEAKLQSQALDQWLNEVHTNQDWNKGSQLLSLKQRLQSNANPKLQLEAFLITL